MYNMISYWRKSYWKASYWANSYWGIGALPITPRCRKHIISQENRILYAIRCTDRGG